MKRKALAAIAALALMLTGCSGQSKDAEFLELVNERGYFQPVSDEDLLAAGHAVCDLLDAGATRHQVLIEVSMSALDPYEGGWLTGAAVATLCPEYLP